MFYTGIDPGMHGAIATLNEDGEISQLQDMPLVDNWYDPPRLKELLIFQDSTVGIEEGHRFPKLTKGIGILFGIASTLDCVKHVHMIPSMKWQKFHGIKKADKNLSLEIARKLFPEYLGCLSMKKHHNRAEALLIASYVRSVHCPISKLK